MDPNDNQAGESVKIEPGYRTDTTNVLFRHRTIRRFRIGRFEFKDNYLRIQSQDELEEFYRILEDPKLPRSEVVDIVKVNEEAVAAAESSIVRGPMASADILTQKDGAAKSTETKATNTGGTNAPNPSLLSGFNKS